MKNYKIKWTFRLLSFLTVFIFSKLYRITGKVPKEVKAIKGSILLLVNHVGFFDPFFASYFIQQKPNFVSSDAVLRDPVKRFFLTGFGVIPKKKNMRDSHVIREMAAAIQSGSSVGLFPEGSRTWTGETLFIDDSIGKLIKLLKVPVVTAKLQGMFLFNPRWSTKIRPAKIEIEYKLLADTDELKSLDYRELAERVRRNLYHDEMKWQAVQKVPIRSAKRAEFMNHVLFYCPECSSFDGFSAKAYEMKCTHCGVAFTVNKFGFFENSVEAYEYKNIKQAYAIQLEKFTEFLKHKISMQSKELLFSDNEVNVFSENSEGDFDFMGEFTVEFYLDRIELKIDAECYNMFYFVDIQTLNPQFNERIEMFANEKAYRFVGKKPGLSGVKWEIAANEIWKYNNQEFKLSSYFRRS